MGTETEDILENPETPRANELMLDWLGKPSPEAEAQIHLDKQRLQHGMAIMGLPEELTHSLAVVVTEEPPEALYATHNAGVYSPNGGVIQQSEHGPLVRYDDIIQLAARNPDGSLRSLEELNASMYHELTHVRQYKVQNVEPRWFDYSSRPMVRASRVLGNTALVSAEAAGAAFGISAVDAAVDKTNFVSAMAERLVDAPYGSTIAAAGLGVLATAYALGGPYAREQVRRKFDAFTHKVNRYEVEANSVGAKLAREFPIFVEEAA